jgi:hypothetical protein
MMSFMIPPDEGSEVPEVDERLAEPEARQEVEDGRVVHVAPADEPHAERHASRAALLKAHRAEGYSVAADMLTRTSKVDDIAPDVSVYPTARNPRAGGRQLEELAFEIVSTESLGHARGRAVKLASRGVRRVFALDVERERALEWSREMEQWSIVGGRIEDRALAVPVPTDALLDAARADDAIVRAWRAKRHPEFVAERLEGEVEGLVRGLIAVLAGRGLELGEEERRRIAAERNRGRIERWLAAAGSCADVEELLKMP